MSQLPMYFIDLRKNMKQKNDFKNVEATSNLNLLNKQGPVRCI